MIERKIIRDFTDAIHGNQIATLEKLYSENKWLLDLTQESFAFIAIAIRFGQFEILEWLLQKGCVLTESDISLLVDEAPKTLHKKASRLRRYQILIHGIGISDTEKVFKECFARDWSMTLQAYMINAQYNALANICLRFMEDSSSIPAARVGKIVREEVIPNAVKSILAQLLFMHEVDLQEERSPLEANDPYLIEYAYLRKRALQIYFLVKDFSEEEALLIRELGYEDPLNLKNRVHKILTNYPHSNLQISSITHWDQLAFDYFHAYQYHKTHQHLPVNTVFPKTFKQLLAPEFSRTVASSDRPYDRAFNPVRKLHDFELANKINIRALKNILAELYFTKNIEIIEYRWENHFKDKIEVKDEELICKLYILFEVFMQNDIASREYVARGLQELSASLNPNLSTSKVRLFQPATPEQVFKHNASVWLLSNDQPYCLRVSKTKLFITLNKEALQKERLSDLLLHIQSAMQVTKITVTGEVRQKGLHLQTESQQEMDSLVALLEKNKFCIQNAIVGLYKSALG